jgi:DNA gyrase subunit B
MINCLSKSEEQIMDNNEIQLLLQALGIVPGKYNPNKLRYGKLAICTDADSDGYHIGLLVMSALAYFAPEFITEERLCWLRSPLYIVKNGKKESYYFSDSEFEKAKDKIKGTVSRAKGLGALSDEQAHNSMFTDEYQRMDILKPDDETFVLLRSLMGDDIEYRKNYIFKNVDFKEIKE